MSFYEIDAEAFRDLKANLRSIIDEEEDQPEDPKDSREAPAQDAAFELPASFGSRE